MEPAEISTGEAYRRFALREAQEYSAVYAELAGKIAEDQPVLDLIEELPPPRRQPNLLLAASRFCSAPMEGYPTYRAWLVQHWEQVRSTMARRRTQTNEAGRCATLLPLLAALPQPLALIEVGASAGLCLYPDRYRYQYDDRAPIGESSVTLRCSTAGAVPIPQHLPTVAWRAGIDLNPLDVRDADDAHWLECLVWPEQTERRQRLLDAIRIARADPPLLRRGDLNQGIEELVAQVPAGATPVIFHSAVLAYLPEDDRASFVRTVRDLPGHWISNEAPSVLPSVTAQVPTVPRTNETLFVLALDGRPVALTGPHGQSLQWLEN
jgi:hypothetical protein